jgi:hypothetical protein
MNLWKKGKLETINYYNLKFKKLTDFKTMFFGLILTVFAILPLLLVIIQFFKLYFYHPVYRVILIIISWILLLMCNGLSNVFMVKLAKHYYPENPNLTKIDEKAIFVYQTFNPGFMVFTVAIILLFKVLS